MSQIDQEASHLIHTSVDDIRTTIECSNSGGNKPISHAVLKRAFMLESGVHGAKRVTVLKLLDRAMRKQEEA